MTDYIDRGSFLQLLDAYFSIPHCNLDYEAGVQKVQKMLKVYPPADVVPVRHAHWIENEDYSLTCSACGHTTYETVREARGDGVYEVLDPYFCPKCSAKMDGGKNEN